MIVLLRHADAVPEDFDLPDDARMLSPHGRIDAERFGAVLRKIMTAPTFYTSPLVRAVQTAELVARSFETPRILCWPQLSPDGRVAPLVEKCRSTQNAVIVSHEPLLSALARALSGRHILTIEKCHALALDADHFWLTPQGTRPC